MSKYVSFVILSALVLLCGCRRRNEFDLGTYENPHVRTVDVSSGDVLVVSGYVVPRDENIGACGSAAILLMHCYDASGAEVKVTVLPYSWVCKGAYRYLPIGRFDLKLEVPHRAVRA